MAYQVDITPVVGSALIDVRADADAVPGLADALGVVWPSKPGAVHRGDSAVVLWLGPDQWLVRAPPAREEELFSALVRAARGRFAAVTVVTDHYRGFRIEGGQVREILAQAVSLDLDALGSERCTRCAFARTRALVQVIEHNSVYDVFVESSYGDYVEQWLEAARE